MDDIPVDKKIILFDGICNLCDAAVQFVIKRDKKDVFRFLAIQSDFGQEIIKFIGIDISKTDSIILYEPGKAYYHKAEAALKISKELGGIYSLLTIFTLLPKGISNIVYDFIARNRYKWYGKKDACIIPTPAIRAKFL